MHYLDIVLGEEYVYQGRIVKAMGTRVLTHLGSEQEKTYVKIFLGPYDTREVKPHELTEVSTEERRV